MEKQIRKLYYLTTGTLPDEMEKKKKNFSFSLGRRKEKELSLFRCERRLSFAFGKPSVEGRLTAAGELQIYFSVLPETIGKELLKPRSRKKWLVRIRNAMDYAESALGCTDEEQILFSERLCTLLDRNQKLPPELYGAFLWEARKREHFRSIILSLPEECSFALAESVKSLLWPYLSRMNSITFTGKEARTTRELEEFFYEEYGIVTGYGSGEREDVLHLNFSMQREMLKFLDTAVKTGYNTGVN